MKKILLYSMLGVSCAFLAPIRAMAPQQVAMQQDAVTLELSDGQVFTAPRSDASHWVLLKNMLEDAEPNESVRIPYLGPQASLQDIIDLFALTSMPSNAKQQWLSQVSLGRLVDLFYVANYLDNEDVLSAIRETIAGQAMLPGGAREILTQIQRFSSLTLESRLLPLEALVQQVVPQTVGLLVSKSANRVQSAVRVISLAPFGDRDLAAGTHGGLIRILRGDSLHYVTDLVGHGGSVNVLAALPHGVGLISGSTDRTMREWKREARDWSSTIIAEPIVAKSLAVLPDGTVVSGDNQGNIKVWKKVAENWHLIVGLVGHDRWVDKLAGISDTNFFSGTLADIKLWNKGENGWVQEGILTEAQVGGQFAVLAAWSDKKLVFGLNNGAVHLWQRDDNGVSSTELVSHPGRPPVPVKSLVCLPHDVVAAGFGDGTVGVFKKVENGWQVVTLVGHTSAVNVLAAMSDGVLVSGSFDGTIHAWVNPYDLMVSAEDNLLLLIAYLSRQRQQLLTLLEYHKLGITTLRRSASGALKNALSKAGWLRSPLHPERVWRWISTR